MTKSYRARGSSCLNLIHLCMNVAWRDRTQILFEDSHDDKYEGLEAGSDSQGHSHIRIAAMKVKDERVGEKE